MWANESLIFCPSAARRKHKKKVLLSIRPTRRLTACFVFAFAFNPLLCEIVVRIHISNSTLLHLSAHTLSPPLLQQLPLFSKPGFTPGTVCAASHQTRVLAQGLSPADSALETRLPVRRISPIQSNRGKEVSSYRASARFSFYQISKPLSSIF